MPADITADTTTATGADTTTATGAEIEAEITIDAPLAAVWRCLTSDIGQWWDHTFSDAPYAVVLEPTIGGRFYEQFDEAGAGALYATITYVKPPEMLRMSGPMGMPGARQYVKTYRLEALGESTRVRTTASVLGVLGEEMLTAYRAGGESLLRSLRGHAEAHARQMAGNIKA
jgi:uncharacterized protein YndB with AHSA1/START domain